ncbi:hypothetical protein PIIN_00183 [Serendipita indica DSM 11827]|uniref:ER membrane protein complex subunit 1 n=1 Tax=Serendipita indica (strain DSM 11827) TaxID=1109443 RepID=G4T5B9_SERID|nr:hypothetical protein PIIN_00183 [Serendipita indica DSM 11827]
MKSVLLAGLLTALASSVNGIYESQVGQIDWHSQYIGVPWIHSPALAPRIHRVGSVRHGTPAQAIYLAATKKNVLAALNPAEGNVVWRRQFDEDDALVGFKANMDGLVSLSGNGGATARIYEAINGNLIWENHLHDPATGHLAGAAPGEPTGTAIEFDSIDVFILSNGHTVRRLSGATGDTLWGWTSPDMASSTFLTSLVRTENALYVLGISKGIRAFSIHITSLDAATGTLLHSAEITANIDSADAFQVLKLGPAIGVCKTAGVVWLESGSLKQVLLTPGLEAKYLNKPSGNKYGPYVALKGLQVTERGYVSAILEEKDGQKDAVHIYKMDLGGLGLTKVGDFEPSPSTTPYTTYAGGIDREGRAYVSKLAHSSTLRSASYEVFAPDAVNGRGMTTGFTFEYDSSAHGEITFAALDVANPSEYIYVSRIILSTSTGAIQQWQQETNHWSREESLTEIEAVAALDLPEATVDSRLMYTAMEETPIQRITRQVRDMKDLPFYLFRFIQRFMTGKYSTVPTSGSNTAGSLWRDLYGFKKVLVIATARGKVFGIETNKGTIVWSEKLGANSPDLSMKIKPVRMTVLKTVSEGFHPEVGIVVEVDRANNQGGRTLTTGLVRVDATTGSSHSIVLFHGPTLEVKEIDLPNPSAGLGKKMIAVVDYDYKVHLYPYHREALEAFNNITDRSTFMLVTGPPTSQFVQGYGISHRILPVEELDNGTSTTLEPVWDTYPTWRSNVGPGEKIVSTVYRTPGSAASHGRVLADRTTLYKYLNPHLAAVVTETRARHGANPAGTPRARCTIYLIDASKGTVLYSTNVPSSKRTSLACDVKMTLVENWLVYHYYEDSSEYGEAGTKGWRMVSVELYEGGPNVRLKSGELGPESPKRGSIETLEQVYVFPSDIRTIATTSTKFGISSKDIIVINGKGQVQTFSRRFLDPRRPKSKPTAAEAEEGLIQFDVLLPDDSRRVVSHNRGVYADKLLTTSTSLESTSLVLAYGTDLFLTRVSPSGTFDVLSAGFNKIQLVLTVSGLGAAILITRPLVRSKVLNARWYA